MSNITHINLVFSNTGIGRLSKKAVDINGDIFSSIYAYTQFLSLRIENRCQLSIAEVYSDKAAADVQ